MGTGFSERGKRQIGETYDLGFGFDWMKEYTDRDNMERDEERRKWKRIQNKRVRGQYIH